MSIQVRFEINFFILHTLKKRYSLADSVVVVNAEIEGLAPGANPTTFEFTATTPAL
jgi:hypothetical protein